MTTITTVKITMTQHENEVEHVRNILKEIMSDIRAEKSIQKLDAIKIQISLDSVIRLATWIKKDIANRIE